MLLGGGIETMSVTEVNLWMIEVIKLLARFTENFARAKLSSVTL
jgi:hypothetical protein